MGDLNRWLGDIDKSSREFREAYARALQIQIEARRNLAAGVSAKQTRRSEYRPNTRVGPGLKSIRRSSTHIKPPPGHLLLAVAEFLFSRRAYEEVFIVAVDDMRFEHAEALHAGRHRKAQWIHVRGIAGLLFAATGVTLGDLVKRVLRIYNAVIKQS